MTDNGRVKMGGTYIHGMNTPKNCSECGQIRWSNFLQKEVCIIAEKIGNGGIFQSLDEGIDNRPTWCPLIPVPDQGDMVIKDYPSYLDYPKEEQRLVTDDLMPDIQNIPIQVLKLALLYAHDMIHYGVDITEKLDTVTRQHEALHRAYLRGICDERNRHLGRETR